MCNFKLRLKYINKNVKYTFYYWKYNLNRYCILDNSETEQLINLVDLVHNCGKKIVIICSTIDKLVSMINYRFRMWLSIRSGKTNPRLISRIKSILPGLDILS